jgi:hypothetical protein
MVFKMDQINIRWHRHSSYCARYMEAVVVFIKKWFSFIFIKLKNIKNYLFMRGMVKSLHL